MYKAVILLKRRAGMAHDEFLMNLNVHVRPLIRMLPGVSRIVVCDAVAGPGGAPVFDAMAEFYFDSVDAVRSLVSSSEARALEAKMAEFVDMDAYEAFLTTEIEIETNVGSQSGV
ncbi:MAG: EthD family reductase [Acidimicrobiia bacterium]|nr:EthD family reductase [Acidimicrobiia bacterium]